jgi:two-component system chemotaxis response regulator CheB
MHLPSVPHSSFHAKNAAYDVVALASSAGGLAALSHVFSRLPADFPAALLVVQHLHPDHKSMMAPILGRHTELKTCEAKDGDLLCPASVYVAPPDLHMLLLQGGVISLMRTDPVKFVRPSADLLFVSVASAYPGRSIAVVLTGNGSDGSTGVLAIKKAGGVVIAQNQATCEYFGMPLAAIETGSVDFVLPLEDIPQKIYDLVMKGMPV